MRRGRRGQGRRARRELPRLRRGGRERDREGLGVAVADFGAGTSTSPCSSRARRSTRVLPIGGQNVTNDIAAVLKTSLQTAEDLKINEVRPTCAGVRGRGDQRQRPGRGRRPDRESVRGVPGHRGADARDLRAAAQRDPGRGRAPAAGQGDPDRGASQLSGIAELGREVLEMPVRVAAPTGIGGLVDTLLTPAYSTSVGLLHWGATTLVDGEPMRYESAPAMGGLGRIRDALRSIFPRGLGHPRADGPDRVGPGRRRPDGGVRCIPVGHRRRGRAAVGVRAARDGGDRGRGDRGRL